MDRLRALEYFVAAAEERSFSAAARRLDVSMPAVHKLIGALERNVGVALFARGPNGLALTAPGLRYFERCRSLLGDLAAAGESIAPAGTRGVVVVGIPGERAERFLGPALPEFHVRFPQIEIDVRPLTCLSDAGSAEVDVFVMFGWQEKSDLVRKFIYRTRYDVVASPGYWATHGVPERPEDLKRHDCLIYRSGRTLLDVWDFEQGGEHQSVHVNGWLASGSRDLLLNVALAGEGVIRATDLTTSTHLRTGHLLAVLKDWTAKQAPPVSVLFRPQHRRTPRIRLFVDFVAEIFRTLRIESANATPLATDKPPTWWAEQRARVSSSGRRR